MIGHPERAQTNVRLVRRAEPRATRSRALRLTVTIAFVIVLVAASFARATGSSDSLIGQWDPPVASIAESRSGWRWLADFAGCAITWLCRSVRDGDIIVATRHIGRGGPILVAHRKPAAAPGLPVRRRAAAHAAYDDWPRTIVDTSSRLPEGYVPPDLVPVSRAGLSGGGSIRRIAIADLKALAKAARKAGVRLAVESAYRSEARQKRTFAGWVRTSGEAEAQRFSARAGHSEHELGTAIDFKAAGGGSPWTRAFARSRHARWLAANAWRFGWIQSYPSGAEDQTCYGAEAWHYRYVGRDVAAEVHASGVTLRAWLWLHASAG